MRCTKLTFEAVQALLPSRKPESHKGDYGKLFLLCGSRGYTGAAYLSAMGALRSGAGLVYLGVPENIYDIMAAKLVEPVIVPLADDGRTLSVNALPEIYKLLPKMDAVLLGPGLGQSEGTLAITRAVLQSYTGPIVVDADGINVIAKHKDVLRERTAPTILTPHMGEFLRLGGDANLPRAEAAQSLARDLDVIVLLKGHETVITDGSNTYLNPTGNPGMAVGGSGDLLAGIMAALLGQGVSSLEAAACAAWLHGKAGDMCAKELGQMAMLPTDMLSVLPRLLK